MKNIPSNIFSGFIVSLVALPLALGLAIASNMPPISGIITAVVAGVVCSILGGSYVTITGPGNGLVVIVAGAMATFGTMAGVNPYIAVLTAVVVSGALVLLAGILRLGIISTFFPLSAIKGMLTAIGILIISTQIHSMLGNIHVEAKTVFGKFAELRNIPEIIESHPSAYYAMLVGVISLAIMVVYSSFRNKYLQLVPAPMWVLIFCIVFYEVYLIQDIPFPIDEDYRIKLPTKMLDFTSLPELDFGLLNQMAFWNVVVALFVISTIESLLSIKAVDQLDVKKRKSNVNKDLRALGIASIVSGFLGGLNVVTVIARSSVNTTNGGSSRLSNFAHSFFIGLMILLFGKYLDVIPLSALAAILVYTGYKLSSPAKFLEVIRTGWDQFFIFLVTIGTTLVSNLMLGILAGIVATMMIHFIKNRTVATVFKNIFRPNTLLFEEANHSFYLSAMNFVTFFNYFRLQKQLDMVPPNCKLVVDLSLCAFVDYSVAEYLKNYQLQFKNKGGEFKVIGIDSLTPQQGALFSSHDDLSFRNVFVPRQMYRRTKELAVLAEQNDWDFQTVPKPMKGLNFRYFTNKIVEGQRNLIQISENIFTLDAEMHEGEFIAEQRIHMTLMEIKLPYKAPKFTMDKEGILDLISRWTFKKEINLPNAPQFNQNYTLQGNNVEEVHQFFTRRLIYFFESHPIYHIESNGNSLFVFKKERLLNLVETRAMIDYGLELLALIKKEHYVRT